MATHSSILAWSPWGCKESDMSEAIHVFHSQHSRLVSSKKIPQKRQNEGSTLAEEDGV